MSKKSQLGSVAFRPVDDQDLTMTTLSLSLRGTHFDFFLLIRYNIR